MRMKTHTDMMIPSTWYPVTSNRGLNAREVGVPQSTSRRKGRVFPTHAWTHTGGSIAIAQLILNPLNAELNPICHLVALLGAHPILHVNRIRVNLGTRWRWVVSFTNRPLYLRQRNPVEVDAERDGTNAETSIGLSAKRTSPFKSAGASVQWTASSGAVRFCGQRLYYL
jgi:hypothetical protein